MKLIFRYLRRHLSIFLLSTAFLTLEAFADLLQPTFMSRIVDDGVADADLRGILTYGLIMLGIALVGAVSAAMRNIFASRTSQMVGRELRSDMYAHIQGFSQENIDRLQPASLMTRLTNDVTQVQNFINSLMRMMIKSPITCVGAIALIIWQTPRQSPVIITICLLSAAWIFGNIRIGYPRYSRVQRALDRLNGESREFLSAIRVVKAFNAEDEELRQFESASGDLRDKSVSAARVAAVFSPLITLTVNLGTVVLLWISRTQDAGQIGRLMASVSYMAQVQFSLLSFSNFLNVGTRASASSRRIGEVLDERPAQSFPDREIPDGIRGFVEFRHVSFAYAGTGKNALNDVSFKAAPGETVGIIGTTGSGKSTLVGLLPRLYDATEGQVLLDGRDVRDYPVVQLREAVGAVQQKAVLFSGTVSDNLRWGRKSATDGELRAAAVAACADDFIEETERGYDTWLGQGGVNLSGGQKQRLTIARALLRAPRVLILDDCTSALDAKTEARVLRSLRELRGSLTMLLISQRISTVMHADRILCLEDGFVRGFDTHDNLLRDCDAYRAIYDSQIGGGDDD